jgi:hypothetical protein
MCPKAAAQLRLGIKWNLNFFLCLKGIYSVGCLSMSLSQNLVYIACEITRMKGLGISCKKNNKLVTWFTARPFALVSSGIMH